MAVLGVEFPFCLLIPSTSHLILSMSNRTMSGIPSKAGQSPDTTKNQHLAIGSLMS